MEIKLSTILQKFAEGYVRYRTDKHYDPNKLNSFEDLWNVDKATLKVFFTHPKLQNLRTTVIKEPILVLEDDMPEYGKPTKAALKRMEKTIKPNPVTEVTEENTTEAETLQPSNVMETTIQ